MATSQADKDDPVLDLYSHPNNDSRIWIGNLDPRVTEFELVRLFRNCGTINKLEYLFHKIGPQAGQPRGYAFLTFAKRDDAIKARREFDGKTLLGRTLLVKPARSVSHDDLMGPKSTQLAIPALSGAKDSKNKLDVEQQIKAIENKLKTMANTPAVLPVVPVNFVSPLSQSVAKPAPPQHHPYSRNIRQRPTRGGFKDRRK